MNTFSARKSCGSTWGGVIEGSIERCIEQQFKRGATSVTITKNGVAQTVNSPTERIIHPAPTDLPTASQAITPEVRSPEPNHQMMAPVMAPVKPSIAMSAPFAGGISPGAKRDHQADLQKHEAMSKAHLCWMLPLMGVALSIGLRIIGTPQLDPVMMMIYAYGFGGLVLLLVLGGFWRLFYAIYNLCRLRHWKLLIPITLGLICNLPMLLISGHLIGLVFRSGFS